MKQVLSSIGNLGQRIIAGLIGAAVVVFCIYYNELSFFVLFGAIAFLTLNEFYGLLGKAGIHTNKIIGYLTGIGLYVITFLVESRIIFSEYYYLIAALSFTLFIMELYRRKENSFISISYTLLGIIYIALPFSLLTVCAFFSGSYKYGMVIGILFLVWANDIGAYIAGRTLGKTKLFPSVSPKKTWEGSIGGAILCLVTALGLSYYIYELSSIQWAILGVIIIVTGSYGDLVESLLKRILAVKDSGETIPGHGGFLDRFDALIVCLPFVTVFLKIFV